MRTRGCSHRLRAFGRDSQGHPAVPSNELSEADLRDWIAPHCRVNHMFRLALALARAGRGLESLTAMREHVMDALGDPTSGGGRFVSDGGRMISTIAS